MPDASLGSLAADLRHSATDLAWSQWHALGASVTTEATAQAIVDPEALILLSLTLRRSERRLTDVIESWMALNSGWISVQRIKNLRRAFPESTRGEIPWLAAVARNKGKDARWTSLVSPSTKDAVGPRSNKSRAVEVRYRSAATLMLQLRRGLGVGVKADILSCLIGVWNQGREWASATMLAEATGYTPAAVRRAADDLAAARFIRSLEHVASSTTAQRMYTVELAAWRSVLQVGEVGLKWRWWAERMAFVADLLDRAETTRDREMSSYAYGVLARELVEAHRATLVRDQIVDQAEFAEVSDWPALLEKSVGAVRRWMAASA
jgi:hypothetical protein